MTNCSCDTFAGSGSAPALTVTQSGTGLGISASSSAGNYCIEGSASGTNGTGVGGISTGSAGCGVIGTAASSTSFGGWFSCTSGGTGLYGKSDTGKGIQGVCNGANGIGVYATSSGSGAYGVYASCIGTNSYGVFGGGTIGGCFTGSSYGVQCNGALYCSGAATFLGTMGVSGYLTKSGGGYRVDHPSDPENKYLNHNFVESPEMMNVYRGRAAFDANGEAIVSLPSYFNDANENPEYQLTAIGAAMPGLYVSEEVNNGVFKLAGGVAGKSVSWQITAARADKWAKENNPGVEIDKADNKGKFLHPELYGKDESFSINKKLQVNK